MITNTRQRWEIGSRVTVGFLTGLTVLAIKSEKDWLPDIYLLRKGQAYYEFIPHNGIKRITLERAMKWIGGAQ